MHWADVNIEGTRIKVQANAGVTEHSRHSLVKGHECHRLQALDSFSQPDRMKLHDRNTVLPQERLLNLLGALSIQHACS